MAAAVQRFFDRLVCMRGRTKAALVSGRTSLSYDALLPAVRGVIAGFERRGLAPGDRIGVSLPNGIEFATVYLACLFGGYAIVPIDPQLPGDDRDYIVGLSRPALLVEDVADVDTAPGGGGLDAPAGRAGDSLFSVFFTSGTTARPKGVCHGADAMLSNAFAFNDLVGLDESVRLLHVMPMTYMAGFLNTLLSPLVAGGTVVLAPRFSAAGAVRFWDHAIESDANAMWLTPTMAALLARLNRGETVPNWTRSALKNVFVGTAPLPGAVKDRFEKVFHVACQESYGMSEALIIASNGRRHEPKTGSAGRIVGGAEVRARAPGLASGKPGEGELWIRSPFMMSGYLTAETDAPHLPGDDGWFATGDIGHVDDEGCLFITGRRKDLIIHGGSNVSPTAVEGVLLHHPRVRDAAVVGVEHPFWGEEVVAFIVPEGDDRIDVGEVGEFCSRRLAPDAVPARFRLMDEFPRSSTGKIRKRELRDSS